MKLTTALDLLGLALLVLAASWAVGTWLNLPIALALAGALVLIISWFVDLGKAKK